MKTFQVSAQWLWGWQLKLDPQMFDSKEELIKFFISQYREFLITHNLLDLKDLLDQTKNDFHIHDEQESFPWPNYSGTIYICNHK